MKEELKICLKQDRDAFDALWAQYEPHISRLLPFLAEFSKRYPLEQVR